jgi:hypothetical protein
LSDTSKKLKQELLTKAQTHYGIYHDAGIILDKYSTTELFELVRDEGEMEISLRAWLEKTIIRLLMNWEKEANYEEVQEDR